jgi:hypothetical protein
MNQEIEDQIVSLLASEIEAYGENLDALEGALLAALRRIGQGALQAATAGKKRATPPAGSRVHAGRRLASSAIETRRS